MWAGRHVVRWASCLDRWSQGAMNHPEHLMSEWLQHRSYFVRRSLQVGPRPNGDFESKFDGVEMHLERQHLIHVEWSVTTLSSAKPKERISPKFERGQRFSEKLFNCLTLQVTMKQEAVFQFPSTSVQTIGKTRIISVRDLLHETYAGLSHTTPMIGAVAVTQPLLRMLQVEADVNRMPPPHARLIAEPASPTS